jgi:hypothetical protein
MEHFDVLVVGGGSAGLAAAVGAARTGAKTLLVERLGALGGMASASLIHSICGLYHLPEHRQGEFCNPGFAPEFARRLLKSGNARGPVRMGRVDVLLHSPFGFARLADQIAHETSGLEVRLHCDLIGCDPGAQTVEILCRGIRSTLTARSFVDASGDGVLAALAGAQFELEPSSRLQRPAYVFSMQNVPFESVSDHARLRIARLLAGAVKEGRLEKGALGAALRAGCKPGEVFVTIDLAAGPEFDPLSPQCLSRLEMEGRRLAAQVSDLLIAEAAGFAQSSIAAFPARIGVRESRRVACEYRLEESDLLEGAQFEDAVAVATWPMELREQATGPKLRYPQGSAPCQIPLRSLRLLGKPNFFVAGRCLGASHEAQASTRVIGTCFATGESAGIAAALRAQGAEVNAVAVNAGRSRWT